MLGRHHQAVVWGLRAISSRFVIYLVWALFSPLTCLGTDSPGLRLSTEPTEPCETEPSETGRRGPRSGEGCGEGRTPLLILEGTQPGNVVHSPRATSWDRGGWGGRVTTPDSGRAEGKCRRESGPWITQGRVSVQPPGPRVLTPRPSPAHSA